MMRQIWIIWVNGSIFSCWLWSIMLAIDVAAFAANGNVFYSTGMDLILFLLNVYSRYMQLRCQVEP